MVRYLRERHRSGPKILRVGLGNEPDHDGLCLLEQEYLLKAIQEDVDLGDHMRDAVNSLRIVLAADEAFRTGRTVEL